MTRFFNICVASDFMIQKLLDNTREDLAENVFKGILMNPRVDDDLLVAGMRFLVATSSSLLDPSTYMNEDLLDRLMDMIHQNSEYDRENKCARSDHHSFKLTFQGLSKRVLSTGLLSIATADDQVSNYVVTRNMAPPLLYRLRCYVDQQQNVKRPKYASYRVPRKDDNDDEKTKKKKKKQQIAARTNNDDNREEHLSSSSSIPTSTTTIDTTAAETDDSSSNSSVATVDDVMSNGSMEMERDDGVNSDHLNEDQLKYMELRMVLRVFQTLGDYLEVLGPFLTEGGMNIVNPLLTVRDKFILTESLKFCSVMLTHQRFIDLFVSSGGLKQILKLPKIPYLIGGVGLCIRDIGQSSVMDQLCKIGPYMEKMVEHCLILLESSVSELKKIGSIFFYAAFSYRPVINLFDKANGLKALVNIFRMPISFPEETVSGKSLVQCACLALRSYFRTHLLLAGFQMNQKKTKKKGKLKYMDVHKIAGNHVIFDIFAKHMNTLSCYLQRQSWQPASDLIANGGISILIELIIFAFYWKGSHVAHCALEVLQLITIAPFTHLSFCEKTRDSSRPGIGVLLSLISANRFGSATDVSTMTAALEVIVNIVCLPEPPALIPPSVTHTRRRICELLRTSDGLGILLNILRENLATNTEALRALACKALLGLSQDATINQILRNMDVNEIVSDLLKQYKHKESLNDFKRFQHYAIELLSRTTGRAPETISMEARDHTLVRLEKADIVSNTIISFKDKELMQIIHEYLTNKGMRKTADQLIQEARIEPLEQEKTTTSLVPSLMKPQSKLENIVTNYLRQQHRECEEPISVLPPLSLLSSHKCPTPRRFEDASMNLVSRMLMKRFHPTQKYALHSFNTKRMDRQFLYNRFRHCKTFVAEDDVMICAAFDTLGRTLFCGTQNQLIQYDVETKDVLSSYSMSNYVNGLRFSKDGSNLLAWVGQSTRLYHSDYHHYLYEFKDSICAEWSNGNDLIVGTGTQSTYIYDALTGTTVAELTDPKLEDEWEFNMRNIACFSPYDDLILSDGVLWDYRIPHSIVHRFDRLSTQGLGIFHPNGFEVIINSEIWDVRTFKLLSTCPALSGTKTITFSPNNDVMYAVYREEVANSNTCFRVFDSRTMETISTIDGEGKFTELAVDPTSSYVACIVSHDESNFKPGENPGICKLFEIGRARKGEEDESDGEEEQEDEDEEVEFDDEDIFEDEELEDGGVLDFDDGIEGDGDVDFEVDGELLAALLRNAVEEDDEDDDGAEEEEEMELDDDSDDFDDEHEDEEDDEMI